MSQPVLSLLHVRAAMDTDIGRKRKQNQDAIGHHAPAEPEVLEALGQIFVLADGVGGLSGGDLASQYAVSTVISSYYDQESGEPAERLARAIAEANNVIFAEGQGQDTPSVMATTAVAAVVCGRDLVIGSVGDSPAYLLRESGIRKLTLDHTLQNLQHEVDGAPLPESDSQGQQLVRALGGQPSVKVDIITGRVRDGDQVVLCSDGLTRYVTPEEIAQIVSTLPVEGAVRALIDQANERGGADNVSVIVLRLSETEELAQLLDVDDPMKAWGRPRASERTRSSQPTVRRAPVPEGPADGSQDTPLRELWALMRGNALLTGVGMTVLLVAFVLIMMLIAGVGGSDKESPRATSIPAQDRTATTVAQAGATEGAAAAATDEAILAATAAESVRRTTTPPTAIPTSGPQMTDGTWFQVQPGDPIPAYTGPNSASERATSLEEGENYKVILIQHGGRGGPWYRVFDAAGLEERWVNAPSLHGRVLAIDESGRPLPREQQPPDIAPPEGVPTDAPPPPTPTPPAPGTPGPGQTPTLTISYGVENWDEGVEVKMLDDLDLCRVPDVAKCDTGKVSAGETGVVVGGPTASGEHWWWQVEFEDGRTGWIAQVLLGLP